ncbi:MAG: response regulator transcription factor [Firmicutes bacterium]|nr:response regulator transcription factor [Bacillota bacterium]
MRLGHGYGGRLPQGRLGPKRRLDVLSILVVEDEQRIAAFLRRGLVEEGYSVDVAPDGAEALDLAANGQYDLILLDILLPKLDGVEVCRRLRQQGNGTPILMLTAKDAVSDKVVGLDAGADDYLTKPFAFEELLARMRALLRRGNRRGSPDGPVLRAGELELDPVSRTVRRGGRSIELTAREFQLLLLLLRHRNQVLTRSQIEAQVWGYNFEGASNVVDAYIRLLRRKIEDGQSPRLIHTVRGVGYVLREQGAKE